MDLSCSMFTLMAAVTEVAGHLVSRGCHIISTLQWRTKSSLWTELTIRKRQLCVKNKKTTDDY